MIERVNSSKNELIQTRHQSRVHFLIVRRVLNPRTIFVVTTRKWNPSGKLYAVESADKKAKISPPARCCENGIRLTVCILFGSHCRTAKIYLRDGRTKREGTDEAKSWGASKATRKSRELLSTAPACCAQSVLKAFAVDISIFLTFVEIEMGCNWTIEARGRKVVFQFHLENEHLKIHDRIYVLNSWDEEKIQKKLQLTGRY